MEDKVLNELQSKPNVEEIEARGIDTSRYQISSAKRYVVFDGEEVDITNPYLKKTLGRNPQCPCGSGIKFKRCCWDLK